MPFLCSVAPSFFDQDHLIKLITLILETIGFTALFIAGWVFIYGVIKKNWAEHISKLSVGSFTIELIKQQRQVIEEQRAALEEQQKTINELVLYSLSEESLDTLEQMTRPPLAFDVGDRYLVRELNHLIDHGYVRAKFGSTPLLSEEALAPDKDVTDVYMLTEAGESLVRLRHKQRKVA